MRVRLVAKIAMFTNLAIIMVMALFAYLNVKSLEDALLRGVINEVDRTSETIICSTRHQMIEGDLEEVLRMLREVNGQKGIELIRLIGKNGRIRYSTHPEESGLVLDRKGEACTRCHREDGGKRTAASTGNSSRFFTNRHGREAMGLAKVIFNDEGCSSGSCHYHPRGMKVLGVLEVVVSLDPMHALVREYRNKIFAIAIWLLVFISLCLTFLTQRIVNRPIRQLVEHTQLLATGEFHQEVTVNSG